MATCIMKVTTDQLMSMWCGCNNLTAFHCGYKRPSRHINQTVEHPHPSAPGSSVARQAHRSRISPLLCWQSESPAVNETLKLLHLTCFVVKLQRYPIAKVMTLDVCLRLLTDTHRRSAQSAAVAWVTAIASAESEPSLCVNQAGEAGFWNDAMCDVAHPYVCEWLCLGTGGGQRCVLCSRA